MNTILKRVISMVLCFVLVAGYLPVGTFATETVETVPAETTAVTEETIQVLSEDAEEPSESTETTEDESEITEPSTEATVPETTEETVPETTEETVPEETEAVILEEEVTEEVTSEAMLANVKDAVDAAIFCSDVHGKPAEVTPVFKKIAATDSSFKPSTASFVGDTDTSTSTVTQNAQSVFSGVECIYAYGSHDSGYVTDYTGVSYGANHDKNYYIYTISQSSMESSNPSTSGFTSAVENMDKTKPLFILSHMPLHARRGDNKGASTWYTAISAAAEKMDIVFFWAHNHTGESDVDTNAYYVAKDGTETMSIQGGSKVTPNFTYMNAGYINANGQNPARKPVATTVKIYEDVLAFQDYDSDGTFTGTYAHNVEVAREFAGSTSGGSGETETVILSSIAVTTLPTKTTYSVGDTFSTDGMVVTATYSDGNTAAVTTYAVTTPDMTTAGTKTVTVTYSVGNAVKEATFEIAVNESESGDNAGGSTVPEEETSNEVTLGGGTTTTYNYTATATTDGATGYILVSNGYALQNNNGTMDAVAVTVSNDESTITFDSAVDVSSLLWTIDSNGKMMNGNYYFLRSNGSGSYITYISTNCASDKKFYSWSYSGTTLTCTSSSAIYYAYYNTSNNAFWTSQNTSQTLKFYVPTGGSSEVTYTMRAENLKQVVDATNTDSLTAQLDFCLQGNGSDLTTLPSRGSYSVTEVSDADNIIDSIDSDGTVKFTGTTGTATVKVAYTWTQDSTEYTVYKNITVETTAPYYELDLHKANSVVNEVTGLTAFDADKTYYVKDQDGTYSQVDTGTAPDASKTYYYVTYTLGDEITAPIAIKGIEAGDKYGVWAVITGYDGVLDENGNDGAEVGAVGNAIEWSSSDTSIATVDPVTGIITFTGKEGTVDITATYQVGNKPSDTITISATTSQYSVPADGTTDFPEYPNEGAIRFDKTATAVGNFSETGIAQLELSMTGVPYTAGSEIDVVLMLDMTGSMSTASMNAAEAAAKVFADQIIKNQDSSFNKNRISVQVFSKDGVTELWALNAVTSDSYSTLTSAIESASTKQASGGTPYSTALKACYEILYAAKSDGVGNNRQQFCVFVSDGTPTSVTYITNTSTPTTTTTVSFTRNNATYTQRVPAYSTGTSTNTFENSANSYHEYWSQLMMNNAVTVYGVYTSASAGSTGSGGGSVNDTTTGTTCMNKVASRTDKVYVVSDYTDTSALTGVFSSIAQEIKQAATDVTVEDKITGEYTMIFDIPTPSTEDGPEITGVTNDFYIEFVKYTLDATTHERTGNPTSVTKLYLKKTNGAYSAAKDSTGNAYDAPVFANKPIGDKGTLYYWTTDSGYASKAALSYTSGSTTYYFIPYGIKATDDGYDATKWFNMTSGGYASGTVNSTTNMSEDLVIATPYFVYNATTKMIYWTLDKLENATTEYALRYFLYLNKSATEVGTANETDPGSYPTNDHAFITYTNFQKHECRREFPIPQLTWSGAQVSYVFYLVNAKGEPINKSGQVVDFANATFVTDVYTEDTVWNKGADGQITADSKLSIEWLANELLPSDYKVYDEAAKYQLHVFGDHTGESIFDYFTISGGTAAAISASLNSRLENVNTTDSTVSLTTTKVYNTKAGEKVTGYGTYTSKETDKYENEKVLNNFDFYNTTVAFAVVWQPALAPDTIVVDYGLDVLINVTFNDLMQDNTISGIGLSREAYGKIAENTGISTTSILNAASKTTEDGSSTISIESNEVQIRFSQNDMTFDKPVTFYYESAVKYYESSEQKDGYLHSSVTVIPATTIYYEDEFVTLTSETKGTDGEWAQDENPAWTTVGSITTATQAQDRPGTTQITGVIDANNNYGYDAAYSSMSEYSLGSAAKANVYSGHRAKVSFEFYGTGFDVISLTSNKTGTIAVSAYAWDKDAKAYSTEIYKSYTVDTYYGYTKNDDGEWVIDNSAEDNALYQVPVMKMSGLEYGKYKVEIVAAYGALFDHDQYDDNSYDFYLDAIRIYDPTGNQNDVANDAYVQDGEGWPKYFEVRNQIITKQTFDNLNDNTISGVVFIDGVSANADVIDYASYGPNNETYLAKNQAIAFDLNGAYTVPNGYKLSKIQLAIKTVGGEGKVEVYGVKNGATKSCLSETISTATDMYYDITALEDMSVVIKSLGDAIISITNAKVTYEPDVAVTASEEEVTNPPALFYVSRASVDAALATLNVEDEVPENPEPSVPAPSEPEEDKPVKPGKTDLKKAVDAAKKLKEKDYTKNSFQAVKSALKAAEKVLKNKKASQTQIEAAFEALESAVENLEVKPDNTALKKAVDKAKKLKEKDYTKDSFKNFKNALKAAEKILKNKNATQAEINEALDELNESMDALVKKTSGTKPGKKR